LVRRQGKQIRVLAPTGQQAPAYEQIDCGGTPTVNDTDLIRLRIDSERATSTSGRLSLRRGLFAPGQSAESGAPEIEIITFARHATDELSVEGTPRRDRFRAGQLDGAGWVNLNANAETANPDADLRLPNFGRPLVGFVTGRGGDAITANGGPEFDGGLATEFLYLELGRGADYYRGRRPHAFVFAGRGADRIVSGRRRDVVFGDRGRDSIRTEGGGDGVLAVGGKDRVWTGRGKDIVYAKDGGRDRVNCGGGSDRALLDAFDRARSCERDIDLDSQAKTAAGFPIQGARLKRATARLLYEAM
jgi:hypothetical protein